MLLSTIMASDRVLDVGVNWGAISAFPLDPNIVVRILKDNGIKKVKLFDADSPTLNALAGSDIQVMVGIPNLMLDELTKYKNAKEWVKKNVTKYLRDGGVDIRYIFLLPPRPLPKRHNLFVFFLTITNQRYQLPISQSCQKRQ